MYVGVPYLRNLLSSAPIGAWKCNFPYFLVIMTNQPTDQTTDDGQKGSWGSYTFNKGHNDEIVEMLPWNTENKAMIHLSNISSIPKRLKLLNFP